MREKMRNREDKMAVLESLQVDTERVWMGFRCYFIVLLYEE